MGSNVNYEVILHRRAAKFLERLPRNLAEKVIDILEELQYDPFSGDVKALKGYTSVFRKRIGKLRIIYYVDFEERRIVILRIAFRERAYENM